MKTAALLTTAIALALTARAAPHAADDHSHNMTAAGNLTAAGNTTAAVNGTATAGLDPSAGGIAAAIAGLKALHLNALAALLSNYSSEAQQFLNAGPVTFLAPSDKAFAANSQALSKMSHDQILATLQYHLLAGNYSTEDPVNGFFHQGSISLAPTVLNNKTYFSLGPDTNRSQVALLSRNDKGFPIIVGNKKNVTFSSQNTTVSQGSLSLAVIDDFLSIPGTLSNTTAEIGLNGLPQVLKMLQLSDALDSAAGLTVFAPTDAAFKAAESTLKGQTNTTLLAGVVLGHAINGTAIYGQDFMGTAGEQSTNTSAKLADGTILLANLTAAGGQQLDFRKLANGTYTVTSNSTTAQIIATDKLFSGGVLHLIDQVLFNPNLDPAAADAAYTQYQTASAALNVSGSGIETATIPGAAPGGANAAGKRADVNFGAVVTVVSALALAGGFALLI